ncbi:MAG: class I SAM-dependent methyltransferase [Lentimicrobium sp.]|nr:class I SAM-dependent methyltransferase [Lentimicrobium sp.]MDD4598844.1 class I SAM-dependent methyltransferase [Lentimicrobiaceae bacterium]MDY0025355.1 class I SAM-dependent methyltransferase [Lentimicrobium sp.]
MEQILQVADCQACESDNLAHYMDLKDFFLSGESFSILECKKCGLLITTPRPLEQDLSRYYQSDDYISHSNKQSDIVSRLYQWVRNYTLSRKVKILKRFSAGKNILDLGCATGEFLAKCKHSGYNVSGVEPDLKARTFAQQSHGLEVHSLADLDKLAPESFDIITQWHVLEHVSDLNARFEVMSKLLKKDGVCIVALPNPNAADAKHYKKYWAAYDVPRHLFHFRRHALIFLANKFDFSVSAILPMKFDSYYVSLLSEKYITGKPNYFKAFLWGLKSNLKARSGNGEYSSLIYVLKKTYSA